MFTDPVTSIFFVVILIISVIIHELAHGYTANHLGDPTARLAGRLTLNPIKHLDWFGSVILPTLLVLSGTGFIIGWAKPVPFNPYNLSNRRWGAAIVALAGPSSNIAVAIIFGLVIRFAPLGTAMHSLFVVIVFVNLLLAVFNLIPVPPLDGHHILFSILDNPRWKKIRDTLTRYRMIFLIFVILFVWRIIVPIVGILFVLITGEAPLL
ncbi:MAG: site-2 protease family protein [Candidatus Nomurabacteria bacterium]|nr:site-2 protease family protein [Candidatus Nomurabacteria bacterium]